MRAVPWAIALLAAPALAQEASMPVCVRQTVVQGSEGWGRGPAVDALALGRSASLKLMPAGTVAFAMPLARAAASGTFGGVFPLQIKKRGKYRIAIGSGAWIDVVSRGKAIESTDHRKGEPCSGIAKIVTFVLAPGDYIVQLSEAKADGMLAMVSGESQ